MVQHRPIVNFIRNGAKKFKIWTGKDGVIPAHLSIIRLSPNLLQTDTLFPWIPSRFAFTLLVSTGVYDTIKPENADPVFEPCRKTVETTKDIEKSGGACCKKPCKSILWRINQKPGGRRKGQSRQKSPIVVGDFPGGFWRDRHYNRPSDFGKADSKSSA